MPLGPNRGHQNGAPFHTARAITAMFVNAAAAWIAESCIRKAVVERGLTPGLVGLADAKAEDEAASRWADFAFAYGD